MSDDEAVEPFGGWEPPPPSPVPSAPPVPGWRERLKKAVAPLGAVGVFLAKFGAILVKLKVLTVIGTMGVSIAAYALLWGWKFAVGFVLLILVHEMGHALMLRHRGIKAGMPVFLPFLGAFISMKSAPRTVYEEAESALAGPAAGTAGGLAVWWVGHQLGSPLLVSLAFTAFLINLFNLLPMLPLDGGRVAGALHPGIWFVGLVGLLLYEVWRPSPVIPIILLLGGYELWRRWRGRNTEAARVYFALLPGQRARMAAMYLGLIALLLVSLHASYLPRSIPN